MSIVTISRGSATGGLLLSEGLAKKLGFDIVSREEIIQGAAKYGVPEAKLERALLEPPTFPDDFMHDRRRYLIFIQEALCERARKDNVIYHGNAGHLLLRGISHVLRIHLIAPMSFRVQMLVEREKMAPDKAAAYIEKVDAQRRAWTLFLYGVDWLNASYYDLTINLENMNVESAVKVTAATLGCREFSTTKESQKAMEDLYLATRVKAALAADAVTASLELEMQADSISGTIYPKGKVQPASMLDAVVGTAKKVTGVKKVNKDQLEIL